MNAQIKYNEMAFEDELWKILEKALMRVLPDDLPEKFLDALETDLYKFSDRVEEDMDTVLPNSFRSRVNVSFQACARTLDRNIRTQVHDCARNIADGVVESIKNALIDKHQMALKTTVRRYMTGD